MIKNFEPRLYQQTIFATCVNKNTLVVLPTGMGKTNIFLMLAAQRLKQYPRSKILLLGPTRPLIDQYFETFKKYFEVDEKDMAVFTGHVSPKKREEMWKTAKIIFSTPQGLENDVLSNKISLEDVSLIGFDEAHRAVENYSYVWIAKQYYKKAKYPRIIGMTASPGSDVEKITQVCQNLYIEDIEARTYEDPDVKHHVKEISVNWVEVTLPKDFVDIKKFLEDAIRSKMNEIKKLGMVDSSQIKFSKRDMLALQAHLHSNIAQGHKDFETLRAISLAAEAMKVQHALELIETQGVSALHAYMHKLQKEAVSTKVKAVKNLVRDLNFRSAFIKTEKLYETGIEHPKLDKMKEIVEKEYKKNKDMKIILFNQYRDNASKIEEELNQIKGIKAKLFVGQAKKGATGLSQKKQKEILDKFRENGYNVLVSTSVGEEGLDIPKVDLVLFYEPIPSAIRHIQRRGRTGRQEKGRVIILMTKGTRDVGYRWSAFHKEKRMTRSIEQIKNKLAGTARKDNTLNKYVPELEIKIIADYREKGSGVLKELDALGAKISLEKLEIADYFLSDRVAVEYKTVEDFVASIIDGRLLKQIKELRKSYQRPIVVVEGMQDIYTVRKVHPNAIRGMIAAIAVGFGVPILYTRNFKETAALLLVIAQREQDEKESTFDMHTAKPLTLREQQEYIVSALPNVGPVLARELLKTFGSVSKVMNAKEEELKKAEKVGEKIAKRIREVLDKEYYLNL